MTEPLSPIASRVSIPHDCGADVHVGEDPCPRCGVWLTTDERRALRERWEANDPEAARRSFEIGRGRIVLAIIAALDLLWGLVLLGIADAATAAFDLVLAPVFFGLWIVGRRFPLLSMVAGLGIYVVLWVATMAIAPSAAASGLPMRAVILIALVGGCVAAVRTREAERVLGAQARARKP